MSSDSTKNIDLYEGRDEVDAEEFIPYACHFDENTLLTKNGELFQVIKIVGFEFESVKNEEKELLTVRRAIRQAVKKNIKTSKFALWFHTIRRKKDLSTRGDYPEGFSADLNKSWCERHDWEHKYVNDLYITIITEGQSLSIKDPKTMMRSFYFKLEFNYRRRFLEKSKNSLYTVVDGMLDSLNEYGAKRLGFLKEDGIYYSEILSFLNKIINLEEALIPVIPVDLSDVLASNKTSFGFNSIEVCSKRKKHFGAILTVKEYHEFSSLHIDNFVQLPVQFIITETFDFINSTKALEHFEQQSYIQRLAGDEELSIASGLADILAGDTESLTAFGEHQINIMIFEDNLKLLKEGIKSSVEALSGLGIVVVREDVFMEDCYWAQLPGNFEFIKRMTPISSNHIGGYASLYNFPAGKIDRNHWGDAITVFYTAAQTPYFFNFHYGDNGHTFIIGPYGAGKTVLMNFLVSESMKYNPKIFFFDYDSGSRIFLNVIESSYHFIGFESDTTTLKMNPLLLPETKENRTLLKIWFGCLISDNNDEIAEKDIEKIAKAIDYSYSLEKQDRILSNVIPKFWPLPKNFDSSEVFGEEIEDYSSSQSFENSEENIEINELDALLASTEIESEEEEKEIKITIPPEAMLSRWYGKEKYAYLFDNAEDNLDLKEKISHGFDITALVKDKTMLAPVILYLLHRIEMELTGKPSIIVMDEAWELLDNPEFAPHIGAWLDRLRKNNTIVLFATESVDGAEKSSITKDLVENIETKIFLPNPNATVVGYEKVFGLSDREFELLKLIDSEKRQFLLKHNVDAVIAELNLDGMDYELAVLASTRESLALMDGAIADVGHDLDKWIPMFKERLFS